MIFRDWCDMKKMERQQKKGKIMKESKVSKLAKKIKKSGGLLMRSGGAATINSGASSTTNNTGSVQRNPYFTLDYYIDSINIKNLCTGKGTGAVHNYTSIEFTVIEPNGITFIDNLDQAVQQYLGGSENKKKNFLQRIFYLILRI